MAREEGVEPSLIQLCTHRLEGAAITLAKVVRSLKDEPKISVYASMTPLYSDIEFDLAKSRDLLPIQCGECENIFRRAKHEIQSHHYDFCSHECRSVAKKRPRLSISCDECGFLFQITESELKRRKSKSSNGARYCSRRCSTVARHKLGPIHKPKPRQCYKCGVSFTTTKQHESIRACPKCHRTRKEISIGLRTIDEIERSNTSTRQPDKYGRIRLHCRALHRDLAERPCATCGYDRFVELCHIRAISDWPKDTLVNIVNSDNNVIQLCPNHHWELDHGYLKLAQPEGVEPTQTRFVENGTLST